MNEPSRAPASPRAQASDNEWRDRQAKFLAEKRQAAAEQGEAADVARAAEREARRTVRILSTPAHTDAHSHAVGLVGGDIAGLPPDLAEHFVKLGVATYELDPSAPAAPEQIAKAASVSMRMEATEAYEVVKSFGAFNAREVAGFRPTQAAALVASGHLRACGPSPLRNIVGRTLDAARRALRAGR